MILVTGGCGYIGSHTIVELLNSGKDVVVLDNLVNSSKISLERITKITEKEPFFVYGDIQDEAILNKIFSDYDIESVIHFAGLKSVGQSNDHALHYFNTNIGGTLNLLSCMEKAGIFKIIFSSSATVYGDNIKSPISENDPCGNTKNPYGTSKYAIERILNDLALSDKKWRVVILRYFNPIGAHSSGLIGEDSGERPDNLMPFITKVAMGILPFLEVYGADYNTPDGSGIRDYIHILDLASGHVKAIDFTDNALGSHTFNLGTGNGYSVFEVIQSFKDVTNITIPFKIVPRREGDIAISYADVSKSKEHLKWEAKRNIKDMIKDTWNWQLQNPDGYE